MLVPAAKLQRSNRVQRSDTTKRLEVRAQWTIFGLAKSLGQSRETCVRQISDILRISVVTSLTTTSSDRRAAQWKRYINADAAIGGNGHCNVANTNVPTHAIIARTCW